LGWCLCGKVCLKLQNKCYHTWLRTKKLIIILISFAKQFIKELWELATPKNISYLWGFGRLLGLVIVIQIASGILLAFYYVRGTIAWDSVVEITREVNYGWLIRIVHRNTASFVFVVLFLHFFRGVMQSSFYLKGPWISGWIIMLLSIAAAFLGYVLPWAQMSFWGATVIINLLSVLPLIGKQLVIWLWGGFYVSFFTCRFFYAAHFLVPFVVIGIAMIHLVLLHFRGRSTSGSLPSRVKMKFSHLFLYKDLVNLILLWFMLLWLLSFPDWSADPVNFVPSDLSSSPVHIQPEWYFLHLYAVLRSIPNKIGGLIGFVIAILVLSLLALCNSFHILNRFKDYDSLAWSFFSINILLMWLGSQAVEAPYIIIGQTITVLYFMVLAVIQITDQTVNNGFNQKKKKKKKIN
jgi:ubiquinol-cytochrome c reductase cytochrome b subunit